MCRSSIFNFESFEGFQLRCPATLLAVIGLLACIEIGIRAAPEKWLVPFNSRLGFYEYMERVVVPQFDHPQVAILGTSRAADAVVPKRLDELLGLPDFSTINLGLPGGRTFDALLLYERNRAVLSQAKVVMLMVDEWNFSSGFGIDARYSLKAPLAERWNFVQPVEIPHWPDESPTAFRQRERTKQELLSAMRNRLLLDYVFNLRLKLRYLPMALLRGVGLATDTSLKQNFDANHQVRTSRHDVGKAEPNPLEYASRLGEYYRDFDTHPLIVNHLDRLARLVAEDGRRFVIVQLPNRRAYQEEAERRFAPAVAQHGRALREFADSHGIPLYVWRFPEEVGLDETAYEDYGHMAFQGGKKFTATFAELIRKDGLLR